jgi:hypothetical protein|tara:strand:+ start:129 stop:374 length:246 start_codon:yes stop_codon:yes gene_type:complete
MFLDLENLNIEQLLEKQIELRKKMSQAHQTGMSQIMGQIQNMLDQVSIEIQTKTAQQAIEKERERKAEDGEDPDDDVLNIG